MIYGYIYKLYCMDTGECYFGSTTNIKKRIYKHRNTTNDCISKNIIERNNYIFLILQEGKYINKNHLIAIEDNYIQKLDCINLNRSFTTTNESYLLYAKKNKEKRKKYWEKNKDIIREKQKEYRKKIGKKYMREYMKKYREAKKLKSQEE